MADDKPTSAPNSADRSGTTEPLFTAADVRQLRAQNAKLQEERDAALAAVPTSEPPTRAQQAAAVSIQLGKYAILLPVISLALHAVEHKFPSSAHAIDQILSWFGL